MCHFRRSDSAAQRFRFRPPTRSASAAGLTTAAPTSSSFTATPRATACRLSRNETRPAHIRRRANMNLTEKQIVEMTVSKINLREGRAANKLPLLTLVILLLLSWLLLYKAKADESQDVLYDNFIWQITNSSPKRALSGWNLVSVNYILLPSKIPVTNKVAILPHLRVSTMSPDETNTCWLGIRNTSGDINAIGIPPQAVRHVPTLHESAVIRRVLQKRVNPPL